MDDHDHRRLAHRMDLFHLEDEAPGQVFWHARGLAVYRQLEGFIRGRMRRLGYEEVRTPELLPRSLWERSGHWEKFSHAMFALPRAEERDLALKPMSCPAHAAIFNERRRSWRELPKRYCEFGQCHRDEPSGAMHGLLRTRAFEQDDGHVFCREADLAGEVGRIITLARDVYAALGFAPPEVALSLRPDLRAGSDAQWDWMEATLDKVARANGLDPLPCPGEGAFYGPKLEFRLRDSQGRAWQCGTIQLDTVLPGRLGSRYVGPNGDFAEPLLIHHAILGSMGRMIGILLEEYKGRLPLWLAPDQVAILPVSDDHLDAARAAVDALLMRDIRAICLDGSETLSRRIVQARGLEVPVLGVIGDREIASGSVAMRKGNSRESLALDEIPGWLEENGSRMP